MPSCVTFGAAFEIGARGIAGSRFRETEIQHLHRAIRRDLDVRRLQVAMDDAALVREVERPRDLSRDVQGVALGQAAPPWECTRCLESLGKRVTAHELEYEKADVTCVFESVNRADVRMIEGRERASFAIEAGEPAGIAREGGRQDFDRHFATELEIPGAVDLAHAADADERLHFVAAEGPAGHR